MSTAEEFLASIDKSKFSTESASLETIKPWGKEVLLTPPEAPFAFKLIHIKAGARLSLQAHDQKVEAWTLFSGEAKVVIETPEGELTEIVLEPGRGYITALGQRHRLVGITDCIVAEASTPELGTTYRLEDDYDRPHETEELRSAPNRGWQEAE